MVVVVLTLAEVTMGVSNVVAGLSCNILCFEGYTATKLRSGLTGLELLIPR